MFARVVLAFLAGLYCIRTGKSIKCYSYACSNYTTIPHPSCSPPKVITCQKNHDSLIPPDRCMTQRMTGEPVSERGIKTFVQHEVRGCSNHLQCRMNRLCDESKKHENIKHCETKCCEGDLCNRDGPVARQVSDHEPTGPTGSDLFCYACSNATEPGQIPGISCSHPIKQQCGIDPLTGNPQDRCVTIVMSRKLTWPFGKVLYQEIRNCSSTQYCSSSFCAEANRTGMMTTCKADCCNSHMCNNQGLPPAMTPVVKPTTAVHEDKFARQGAQTFPPTEGKKNKRGGASRNHSCFNLMIVLGIFVITSMIFTPDTMFFL